MMNKIHVNYMTRIIIQVACDKVFFSWFGMLKYIPLVCHSSSGERRSKNRIEAGGRLVWDVIAVDDDGGACKTARTS